MLKKLSLLVASIAVAAVAVPAFASAAPSVTDPPNVLLAKGAKFQLTNIGPTIQETIFGKISCGTFSITGELTSNTGSTVRGIGAGQGSASGCTIGAKVRTITDITLRDLHSSKVGSGTISITFIEDWPNGIVCHFESTNLPFTYTSGTDLIRISQGALNGTPKACEPSLLTAEFTIETDGGGAVILD